MNVLTAYREGPLRLTQSIVILLLASLLVFYHLSMLTDLVEGHGLSSDTTYNAMQGVLRLSITVSLIGIVLGKRNAIWAMWLSIGGLVATQYWAQLGYVQADFTAGRHPLSYLKGFIFPAIITAAFFYRRR